MSKGSGKLPPPPKGPGLGPDKSVVGGSRQLGTGGRDAKAYLWAGTIMHVDTETMVCSVRLDSGQGIRHDVPIPAPGGSGPRSWSGTVPEIGTKVILGWKRFDNRGAHTPYIVEFLTPGVFPAREFEPFSSLDPEDAQKLLQEFPDMADEPGVNTGVIRLKSRKVYPGDYLASSSSGSDFILDRDVYFTNRAGNEFRLRDSDQTAILQTRNEFVSNGAGYYRRGLIRRNAFNFLPDLYPKDPATGEYATVISPGDPSKIDPVTGEPEGKHPAYDILLSFGLILEDGSKNFVDDPNNPVYPYVVHADGRRSSYVVPLDHTQSFNDTPFAYTEDRLEMRLISDGVMPVTEEGDGFQIDPPYPVFIEDVKGTIVGNDFHSDAGRPLYKRPLTMRLFSSVDDGKLADGPTFEPIDTVTRMHLIDDIGLARLFRIQSPNNSNQFCYGITKEGRVFLHVPKSRSGEPHEKGKSIDLNVAGLIKGVIGADENSQNMSIDLRILGGVNLEIGRLGKKPTGDDGGESVRVNLKGGIQKIHHGDPSTGIAEHNVIGGAVLTTCSSSMITKADGTVAFDAGSEYAASGQKITHAAGPGGLAQTTSGDYAVTVLGKTQQQYAQIANITYATGKLTTHLTGVDQTTMLAGGITRTLVAGAAMADTVVAGNMAQTVATGNMSLTVGAGNLTATVGSGALVLSTGAGPVTINSALLATISATTVISHTAPINKIGVSVAGYAVAGIPGPPAPHLDYVTGIPVLGIPTVLIG